MWIIKINKCIYSHSQNIEIIYKYMIIIDKNGILVGDKKREETKERKQLFFDGFFLLSGILILLIHN